MVSLIKCYDIEDNKDDYIMKNDMNNIHSKKINNLNYFYLLLIASLHCFIFFILYDTF